MESREELVEHLVESLRKDAVRRSVLVAALQAHRRAMRKQTDVARLVRAGVRDVTAAPGLLSAEAITPSKMQARSQSLAGAWQKVGGYLGESMAKFKAGHFG